MKYMGSKNRIAKHIVPIIHTFMTCYRIDTYVEPFVGGANVIDKISATHKFGFDKNKYLIALLQRVQSGKELYGEVSKELYDKARTAFNSGDTSEFEDWEIGNIGFLASYNGRWFDGGYAKPGYEVTKTGKRYRDYFREATDNILNQAPDLKDIQFECRDYKDCLNKFDGSDPLLIYCDPPYQNTKQYKNASDFDYDEFWQTMREWSEKHVVLISEQTAPEDFNSVWVQDVSRSIKAADKSRALENLFIWSKAEFKRKPKS